MPVIVSSEVFKSAHLNREYNSLPFSILLGKTITKIFQDQEKDPYDILFVTSDGEKFILTHVQDCSENIFLEDICGDLEDILDSPIIQADEEINDTLPCEDGYYDSYTWTFYKLATIKGSVTLRWYSTSNGYYSEEVELFRVTNPND